MKVIAINQISAIACLTLRENIRGKAFIILIVAGISIAAASAFAPVIGGSAERVMLMESLSLKVITFFAMITAAILSSTSIPKEAEDKSIYSITTKPVSRLNLVLGKILGFMYITGVTIIALGLCSILLIRDSARTPADKPEASDAYGVDLPAATNGYLRATPVVTGDALLMARKVVSPTGFTGAAPVNLAIDGGYQGDPDGIMWIEGGKGTAVCTIDRLQEMTQAEYLEVEIDTRLEGDTPSMPLQIGVTIPETGRNETIYVDSEYKKRLTLQISRQIVGDSDRMAISITPTTAGTYLGISRDNIRIFDDYTLFEYNFLKACMVIFIQASLLIFIGVTASTFFKTPAVSAFFVLFILLCGFMAEYLRDFETILNIGDTHVHDHAAHTANGASSPATTSLNALLGNIFTFLIIVVPDFNGFNMESFILNRIDISIKMVLSLSGYASIYCLTCVGIVITIIRRREL